MRAGAYYHMIMTNLDINKNGKAHCQCIIEWPSLDNGYAELEALFWALLSRDICTYEELHKTIDNALSYSIADRRLSKS